MMRSGFWVLLLGLLVGCAVPVKTPNEIRDIGKSDTAFFVEAVRMEVDRNLSLLLVKLYRRNPIQMPKGMTEDFRLKQLRSERISLSEFSNAQPDEVIRLAFDPKFKGDRVFALVAGLQSMVNASYNYRREFFLLDELPNPQYVFNAARNLETAAYLLRTRLGGNGVPLILADGVQDGVLNASYSQLIGEMIGLQDALAVALGKKDQRTINAITRGVASSVFLPVGF